jgi:glucose-1-phosphate cytidylyltransferase
MKAVILAGGFGSRLSEETVVKPKPMVEIGEEPILWHILKIYAAHGIQDFVICLGYKGWYIKDYFARYFTRRSDVTFDLRENRVEVHNSAAEPWRVTLVETGPDTYTGGRLKRVARYLDDEPFCFTYGDGVSDVNVSDTLRFHREHGKLATMTVIQPPGRFGTVLFSGESQVQEFQEKPKGEHGWVNGGFFVLDPKVLDFIDGDQTWWEHDPMRRLAAQGQLMAYKHDGFWQCMDHLSDKNKLEKLWASGQAPWKKWK